MVNSLWVNSLYLIVSGRIVNGGLGFFSLLYLIIGLDVLILQVNSQPKGRSLNLLEIIFQLLLWPIALGIDMYHLLVPGFKTKTFDRK